MEQTAESKAFMKHKHSLKIRVAQLRTVLQFTGLMIVRNISIPFNPKVIYSSSLYNSKLDSHNRKEKKLK